MKLYYPSIVREIDLSEYKLVPNEDHFIGRTFNISYNEMEDGRMMRVTGVYNPATLTYTTRWDQN